MTHEVQTVPLPPVPEAGLVEPFATTGELVLLALGAFITVCVAVAAITFFVRMQRQEGTSD